MAARRAKQVGGASFYFGLEQHVADPVAAGRYLTYGQAGGPAINAQYGIARQRRSIRT